MYRFRFTLLFVVAFIASLTFVSPATAAAQTETTVHLTQPGSGTCIEESGSIQELIDRGVIVADPTSPSGWVPAAHFEIGPCPKTTPDPGPQPTDEVTYGPWTGGTPTCDMPSVTQSRTVTTTPYVLSSDGSTWVLGNPGSPTTENQTLTLSAEEQAACNPPDPGPQPTDEVVYGEWSNETPTCDVPSVTQSRTVLTTSYALNADGSAWIAGDPAPSTETRTVSLSADEQAACQPDNGNGNGSGGDNNQGTPPADNGGSGDNGNGGTPTSTPTSTPTDNGGGDSGNSGGTPKATPTSTSTVTPTSTPTDNGSDTPAATPPSGGSNGGGGDHNGNSGDSDNSGQPPIVPPSNGGGNNNGGSNPPVVSSPADSGVANSGVANSGNTDGDQQVAEVQVQPAAAASQTSSNVGQASNATAGSQTTAATPVPASQLPVTGSGDSYFSGHSSVIRWLLMVAALCLGAGGYTRRWGLGLPALVQGVDARYYLRRYGIRRPRS
jgi:hypothetical protein